MEETPGGLLTSRLLKRSAATIEDYRNPLSKHLLTRFQITAVSASLLLVADTLTKALRSARMSLIRSKGNKATEVRLARILRQAGITGWRRQGRILGNPDFVFPKARLAVFVDGCFWHGCRWHCRKPKSRAEFWNPKIDRNRQRDRVVGTLLRLRGWRVLRIWEHSLSDPAGIAHRFQTALASSKRKR